jgi:hypothetical protein
LRYIISIIQSFLTIFFKKARDIDDEYFILSFINSAIRYPLFLQEEMKKENPVVDGEFQRAESNPVFWLLKDMDKKLWGAHFIIYIYLIFISN